MNKSDFIVGGGATVCFYTDRQAFTIIRCTDNMIELQRDKITQLTKTVISVGGFCGHCSNNNQIEYSYEKDANGKKIKAHWSKKKERFIYDGMSVILGKHEFYDFNF